MKYFSVMRQALTNYDIKIKSIKYLLEETNTLYKVIDDQDTKYLLKIFQEESSSLNDNLAEHYLIDVITSKTEILTPKVIKNIAGETVTKIPYKNNRGYKRVVLYSYLSGKPMFGKENSAYFESMGEILAKMHQATEELSFPEYVNPKKMESIFYFENEKLIYNKKKYKKYITKEMKDILAELIPYINQKLKAFYSKGKPQLIHGDLNPWHINRLGERFVIYDFEEALYAYPIHDIAVFLYYYKYNEKWKFNEVKKALFKGYESVKPLPKNLTSKNLELLMMSRRINFFNYVLSVNKHPKEYIETSFSRIKEYYITYK